MKTKITSIAVIFAISLLSLISGCIIIDYHPEYDKGRYLGIWEIMESNSKITNQEDSITISSSINGLNYYETIINYHNNQLISDITWTFYSESWDWEEYRHNNNNVKVCTMNFYDSEKIYKTYKYMHTNTIAGTDTTIKTTVTKRYEGNWKTYKRERHKDKNKIVYMVTEYSVDSCFVKTTPDGFYNEDHHVESYLCTGNDMVWTYEIDKAKDGITLKGNLTGNKEYGYENLFLTKRF